MADADALREAPATGVTGRRPTGPPPATEPVAARRHVPRRPPRRAARPAIPLHPGGRRRFDRRVLLRGPIRNFLLEPLPGGVAQVLGPGDAFAIQLRISIVVGVILAMPVLLYQVWAFVAPGLTPTERRTVRPWIPLALVFFALGVAIASSSCRTRSSSC